MMCMLATQCEVYKRTAVWTTTYVSTKQDGTYIITTFLYKVGVHGSEGNSLAASSTMRRLAWHNHQCPNDVNHS
jgi:hypothetical protein